MINDSLQGRKTVVAIIMSAVIVVYILRLFTIQILDIKYKEGAESNAFLKKTLFPPRGLIYDRNHKLLVYNKPAYDIALIMREVRNLDTLSFCAALNIQCNIISRFVVYQQLMIKVINQSTRREKRFLQKSITLGSLLVFDIKNLDGKQPKYIHYNYSRHDDSHHCLSALQ
jgi:cell division protein FtsI/penicillin-binding protein 2